MKSSHLYILFLCVFCMAVIGCRPRHVLSNKQMRDVLYDIHRTDGAIQVAGYTHGHNQELAAYYKSVLDKHGVTQAQFDSSLVWFTDNPQIFNKIYPNVIQRLQADMDREEALRDARLEKMRSDKKLPHDTKTENDTTSLRPLEEIQKEYLYGIENPWKIWKVEEFFEKSVVIFGQLEKK